jgi:hypothetical protein
MSVLSQSLVAEERLIAGIASDWLGSNEKKTGSWRCCLQWWSRNREGLEWKEFLDA